VAAAVRDMGQRLAHYRNEVERIAFHDQLTGLPNRVLIRELLGRELERARAAGRTVAVLFFDLDNFKQINDALGHAAGDELLRALTRRLSALLETDLEERPTHLARIGGDELLIVVGAPAKVEEVADLAGSLLEAAAKPFDLGTAHFVVTASIGVAFFPQDATDSDGLIRCADLAMYAAKAEGRNAVRFFSQELNAGLVARLHMENALRHAVGRGELAVRYQPIVDLKSEGLWAFEALLRWRHPELGEVSPQCFIPVAEETGVIQEIGHWVLAETCRQLAAWRDHGLTTVPVSVNVSAAQIRREDLTGPIVQLLKELGLSARDLHLEITESLLVDLSQTTHTRLRALADLGIAIHVDDFGTGYSSLSYLRRIAVDVIKIDKTFVAGIVDQDEDRALVSAMIAMAHALNLRVIAEGIEKPEQVEVLRGLGCDLGQGFFFSYPVDADSAAHLLIAGIPLAKSGPRDAGSEGRILASRPPRRSERIGL
jgi:diguanylate cyclase (GGDEF)-like protein